ncbi:MAG: hypothetical protein PF447_00425, partial [Spirochaetaceae bacterium]|nr:hypothetical protein [Spirochaetaceae bacterium]
MIKKFSPPVSEVEATKKAKVLLNKMTIEEKINLIGGTEGFYTQAIERLDIPEVFMADASQGVNIRHEWQGVPCEPCLEKSTAFPAMLQLASTWNTELAGHYAQAVGEESRAGGIAILLGPGMNIYRHSQCGRNFEYLGEDPYLISRIIENYVTGLQSTGVAATLKHFLANNTDYYRRKSNSLLGDRALHEIYLPAFKAGIEAGAMAVMTSYNQFRGKWCSQSNEVINGLLREQLGFDWLVMTDWWAIDNALEAIKSGLNLEMPARKVLLQIEELMEQGKV